MKKKKPDISLADILRVAGLRSCEIATKVEWRILVSEALQGK